MNANSSTSTDVTSHNNMDIVNNGVTDPNSYYGRKAEGWFFYNDPALISNNDEENFSNKQEENKVLPMLNKFDPEKRPLSTAWLRKNLPKYLDLAIDNPTSENVLAYFYLQRISLDKASAFAMVAKELIPGNTYLDENIRRPLSTFGGNLLDKRATLAKKIIIDKLVGKVSFIYLFDSSDPSTSLFSELIHTFGRDNKFYIKAVDCAENPNPSNNKIFIKAPNIPKAKISFKAQVLPALYIYSGQDKVVALSQGYLSLSELYERIIISSHRLKLISDDEYQLTLPFNNVTSTYLIDGQNLPVIGEDNLVQPKDIVKLMEDNRNE